VDLHGVGIESCNTPNNGQGEKMSLYCCMTLPLVTIFRCFVSKKPEVKFMLCSNYTAQCSSVGIVTDYRLDGPGIKW